MKIGFLISGELGYIILKNFYGELDICFVMTDSKSKEIIEFCKLNTIAVFIGNPRDGKADLFIKDIVCDVIASVNYIFLIDEKIIKIGKKIAFNIHGSLLPKYRGRTPHVWAIINGENRTGITAHIIETGCDTGPIIDQIEVEISPEDTGASILEKYKILYIPLIEKVLQGIEEENNNYKIQDETKATYFGKRTPDDGKISWDWHANRIINWVRAQSNPYPGAFTFYNNNKIIIDEVVRSDFGFHYGVENGTILSVNPLIVKCSNYALEVKIIRGDFDIFKIDKKFN